jgi:hypothetical protein
LATGSSQNRIELETKSGWIPTEAEPTSVLVTADDLESAKRFGAVTRQIETVGNNNQIGANAQTFLPWAAPGAKWAADTLVLPTHVMTDAQLDQYANHFAPQPTVTLTFRRHIAVLDIQSNVDVTAGMLFGDLVGASFIVNNGRLEIHLRTKPAPMYLVGGIGGGPTINAWNASAWVNTYLTDQGGANDYIDPELTIDHFAVSTL